MKNTLQEIFMNRRWEAEEYERRGLKSYHFGPFGDRKNDTETVWMIWNDEEFEFYTDTFLKYFIRFMDEYYSDRSLKYRLGGSMEFYDAHDEEIELYYCLEPTAEQLNLALHFIEYSHFILNDIVTIGKYIKAFNLLFNKDITEEGLELPKRTSTWELETDYKQFLNENRHKELNFNDLREFTSDFDIYRDYIND